jgi:hypothetical protein
MYEAFQPLTTVMKSHFVHWFSGKDLSAIWTLAGDSGHAGDMVDEIDGGYKISTPNTSAGFVDIMFSTIRHYDHQNCTVIWVAKMGSTTNRRASIGFGNTSGSGSLLANSKYDSGVSANYLCQTSDGTASTTAGSVTADTSYHTQKIACITANTKLTIDGVLDVTKTTNLPNSNMQPWINSQSVVSAAINTITVTYCEAYGT